MRLPFSPTRASGESSQQRGRSDFRASLYKDAPLSDPPRVGTHPFRGNVEPPVKVGRARSTSLQQNGGVRNDPSSLISDSSMATDAAPTYVPIVPDVPVKNNRRRRPMSVPGPRRAPRIDEGEEDAAAVPPPPPPSNPPPPPPNPNVLRKEPHRSDGAALTTNFSRLALGKSNGANHSPQHETAPTASAATSRSDGFAYPQYDDTRPQQEGNAEKCLPIRVFSEDVADRNKTVHPPSIAQPQPGDYNEQIADRNMTTYPDPSPRDASGDRYEGVATHYSGQPQYRIKAESQSLTSTSTNPAALSRAPQYPQDMASRQNSIARKRVGHPPSPSETGRTNGNSNTVHPSSKLDRPTVSHADFEGGHARGMLPQPTTKTANAVTSSSERPSLEGIVDLTNTVDTDVRETQAPAVCHETIYPEVRRIREEVITREIHLHDVYHRILPVIDVQILPARHFVPIPGGGLREATAEEVSGRQGNWQIVETVSHDPPTSSGVFSLFSEQTEPVVISRSSHISPEGYPVTETEWKHPPVWDTAARDAGQTKPFFIPPKQLMGGGATAVSSSHAISSSHVEEQRPSNISTSSARIEEQRPYRALTSSARVEEQRPLGSNREVRERGVTPQPRQPPATMSSSHPPSTARIEGNPPSRASNRVYEPMVNPHRRQSPAAASPPVDKGHMQPTNGKTPIYETFSSGGKVDLPVRVDSHQAAALDLGPHPIPGPKKRAEGSSVGLPLQ
ncbi:MAG: hypothetical protein M1837_001869 [Sclerophora amabilis]|nr:MAG: hypothetical protein M1837_001869 [Sclerophora amabilis]